MEEEKNTSTDIAPDAVEQPAEDTILSTLTDTDSSSSTDEPADETSKEGVEPEAEAEPGAEPEPEEQEEEKPLDPKVEAQRRYEERQAIKAEREARIREQNREYLDEAENDYDQRLRAMEIQKYNDLVESNENKLVSEYERVANNPDLQIFNVDNPEKFNQKAYERELKNFNAGYIEYDDYGNIVGVKGSLYEYLTEAAAQLKEAVKTGAFQQVKATKTMRSNADSKPAANPKPIQKDEILEILTS